MYTSLFNLQEEFQAELYIPKCLEDAKFNYKYHELVHLFLNLSLIYLEDKVPTGCFPFPIFFYA